MLGFVIAEEDLRIETSYPFNELTAVFLLNNSCYQYDDSWVSFYAILQMLLTILTVLMPFFKSSDTL